ncbi:MAG TPA: hypothetical protein V6D19_07290 [Stenomitos sp.]
MTILKINDLALQLVANDFSKAAPNSPTNGGPTKTSRALAIIHLAAHDAYAKVTGQLMARLPGLPEKPDTVGMDDLSGTIALIGAGLRAAVQLYPDQADFIAAEATKILEKGGDPKSLRYGEAIADAWINARKMDGSEMPQEDAFYDPAPGRHRPDPSRPGQKALGRSWGLVTPFALDKDIAIAAPLKPPCPLTSPEYARSFNQVIECGKETIVTGDPDLRKKAQIGIFWGYDGANKLGTPPRLYNQVVRCISEFKTLPHWKQIKLLTAINVAMADAGIAAWYWKYEYDFWRPVVAIREAEKGFGPTGLGDGNTLRKEGDPFWLPLGAPSSNPVPPTTFRTLAALDNSTPPFPAYPSGHATFGTACFEVAAYMLGKSTEEVCVTFVSDEFNGITTDNTGATRPKWEQTFSLHEAIEQNKISRVYLGVHWDFDASGGDMLGKAVAQKVVEVFG